MMLLPLFLIRKKLLSDSRKLGQWGEKYCQRYLRAKGFVYIAGNFSIRAGEIDLVMADNKTLVFVEVKTRSSEDFAKAQEAVNQQKRNRIIKTAKYFLKKYNLTDEAFRFDVVTVILGQKGKPQVEHFKKAFRLR